MDMTLSKEFINKMGIKNYYKGPHDTFLIRSDKKIGTKISFLIDRNKQN